MNQEKKLPENVLIALAFFAGLFGFIGILLVGGYCYLADKREYPKQCALISLFIAIGFAVLVLLLNFIGLFTNIGYAVYNWIDVIEKILYAVLGFVMLFGAFRNRRDAQTQEVKSDPRPSPAATESAPETSADKDGPLPH